MPWQPVHSGLVVGELKGEDAWYPLITPLSLLKRLVILGPREARASIACSLIQRCWPLGVRYLVLDTARLYRALLRHPKAKLYRLGYDTSFNPFRAEESWSDEELHSYAQLVSKYFAFCFNLTRLHASLLCRALARLYQEKPDPSAIEVLQAVEGEATPIARGQTLAEEVKLTLTSLLQGYAATCLLSQGPEPPLLDELGIVELSRLATYEVKAFIQACLAAKCLISGLQPTLVIEDAHALFPRRRGLEAPELLSLDLTLLAPSQAALSEHVLGEASLTLEATSSQGGWVRAKVSINGERLEARLEASSLEDLSDGDADALMEERLGRRPEKLKPVKARPLTTLEELFPRDDVRREVYAVLSYLRDNYSTFRALFELMNLPSDVARKALIKLHRHKVIAQSEVGGAKVVTLTDFGRLVLEEYESVVGGGNGG